MNLTTEERCYRQLLLGDRTIQILGVHEGENVPMAGEIIYYNDFEMPLIINRVQEVWHVQGLNNPEFLAHVVFDGNYYAAIEAQWKYNVIGECRIYALHIAPYDELVATFRNTTILSIGRLHTMTAARVGVPAFADKCQHFEYIGVLSAQIHKHHPDLPHEEIGRLTAGVFNGKYFAYLLYLPVAYGEHDLLLGYVIFDQEGIIISEAQSKQICDRLTPELLHECRLICDEQGLYSDEARAITQRHLRRWVYYALNRDTTGVLDVD